MGLANRSLKNRSPVFIIFFEPVSKRLFSEPSITTRYSRNQEKEAVTLCVYSQFQFVAKFKS